MGLLSLNALHESLSGEDEQNSQAHTVASARKPQIPLSLAHENSDVVVVKVLGSPELKAHLANLGFVKDASVRIVTKNSAGDVIVVVKGSRFALDGKSASRILTC